MRDGSNQRDDAYGGSVENRMRMLNEVLDAVLESWDSGSVGVRYSPENSFNSMSDSDPQQHFDYFVKALNARKLAYLHVLEGDMMSGEAKLDYRALRDAYDGVYIANCGYDQARAEASLAAGDSDLVAFGVPFIANPDLVHRFRNGIALAEADQATFYGGDETGYTDYPVAEA